MDVENDVFSNRPLRSGFARKFQDTGFHQTPKLRLPRRLRVLLAAVEFRQLRLVQFVAWVTFGELKA
jgi:hypothetical protein